LLPLGGQAFGFQLEAGLLFPAFPFELFFPGSGFGLSSLAVCLCVVGDLFLCRQCFVRCRRLLVGIMGNSLVVNPVIDFGACRSGCKKGRQKRDVQDQVSHELFPRS